MTTGNQYQHPPTGACVIAAGLGAGTYYAPYQTGVQVQTLWHATQTSAYFDMSMWDNLSIQGYVTAVGAATCTLTVWSDDGSGTWVWNETLGGYDSVTNSRNATYVGTGGANTYFHLHFDNFTGRRAQVRVVLSDNTGAAYIVFRQSKV